MEKKRVLLATHEIDPYLIETEAATLINQLSRSLLAKDYEVRVLIPRFGVINERRHRLHEVVRLSGINIVIEEDDYPLLIKVASLQETRMQVYFLDNEEFFKRKQVFADDEGNSFDDNTDRMVFFCRGVMETVKKFGWAPDIIHAHGWMTSLIPLFLKTAYKKEAVFADTKIIYSAYPSPLQGNIESNFYSKALIKNVNEEDLKVFADSSVASLHTGAVHYADGVIVGAEGLPTSVLDVIHASDKPHLDYAAEQDLEAYINFYQMLFAEETK